MPKVNLCNIVCWLIGLVAGVVAYWLSVEAVTWFPALLVGLAVAAFIGLVLDNLICGASSDQGEAVAGMQAEIDAVTAENATEQALDQVAAAPVETAAPAPEPKAIPAAETSTPDYDGDGVLEGEGEGKRPEALSGPRDGKADNLKEIKGIGPKLEVLCNELGFYHFDQIAGWSADEIAWVNANLKGFKGRVTRDDWVAQAKILAAGGETEFSARVDKGGVY